MGGRKGVDCRRPSSWMRERHENQRGKREANWVVEISILIQISVAACEQMREPLNGGSHPSRYRITSRYVVQQRFISLHPSRPDRAPSSNRCKFHYWPTESAALSAMTHVRRGDIQHLLLDFYNPDDARSSSVTAISSTDFDWPWEGIMQARKIQRAAFLFLFAEASFPSLLLSLSFSMRA